ncbi:MAG: PPC domain-containing protein [Planctomycetaceae bacterium]
MRLSLSQLSVVLAAAISLSSCGRCRADEPTAVAIFPAGGQRGTSVAFKVAGHYLHDHCEFRMEGAGIEALPQLSRCRSTVWFEGPVLPLPDSQQKEDYPVDHDGTVVIAADAASGVRWWRVATSQGVTTALPFVIGELPEIVEQEIEGEPIPELVQLPLTINGRIFPRQDRDIWTFEATAGQLITCEVTAARILSPLDSRLTLLDPVGNVVAIDDDTCGRDSRISFKAATTGRYQLQIEDADQGGLQHYIYRLTIKSGADALATYPLGARRGQTLSLESIGQLGEISTADITIPVDAPAHLPLPGNPELLLEISDLDEQQEQEPNDAPARAAVARPESVWNGRIQQPGDSDCWNIELQQGQAVEFDLRAARLNSPLDSVLSISDSTGKKLAESDDLAQGQPDSLLLFTAPAAGIYTVSISDRFPGRGGGAFGYRLHVRSATSLTPDFTLTSTVDAARVLRGSECKLKISAVRKSGFAGEIRLVATGLPGGVTCEPVSIEKGKSEATLVFKAATDAPVSLTPLMITGRSTEGDRQLERVVTIPPAPAALPSTPARTQFWLAVSVATPFKVAGIFETRYAARGSTFVRHYKIDRGGYSGPLTVRLSERQTRHLQGVTGPEIVVPADATEFDYAVFLPPWMEIGRTSRTCLMATGLVTTEDGRQHPVSYTSFEQSDQIIVLVDPERMSLQLPQSSLQAIPGSTVQLYFEVRRGSGVTGPVQVSLECPPHIKGLTSSPVQLAADATSGKLTLRFAEDSTGPWNMPLKVSARCESSGQLFSAESLLQVAAGLR